MCIDGVPSDITTDICGKCVNDASCTAATATVSYKCDATSGMCVKTDTNDGSDSDNLGLILGLTIPIGVILIAVIGFCCWKKKQADEDR